MTEQQQDPQIAHDGQSGSTDGLDFPSWEDAIAGITDSRFVGHRKIDGLHTNCTRAGARIMYDRLYVLLKSNAEVSGGGAFPPSA